jgi:predicted phosphodiesterase
MLSALARRSEVDAVARALLSQGRYPYVISGHTHRPMVRALEGVTIINAGTLLGEHSPCCSVIDLREKRIQFYDVAADGSVSVGEEWQL